jgi:hypothetical protein
MVQESQSARFPSALAVLAMLVLGAGCESGYQFGRPSAAGGYASGQEDSNVFSVRYSGNVLVSKEKASDLALMRAAELTLEYGFEYLAVIASQEEGDPRGRPSARLVIGCFRKEPKHIGATYDVYKASDVFEEMALKYEFKRDGEPTQRKRGPFTPGANAIVVEDDPTRIHRTARFNDVDEALVGFVADLYMVPTPSLGIEWEPGDMLLGKYIIRRFRPGSRCAEAGLKLGDKVLAINNIDVLETNGLLRQSMRWSVDEKAVLAVVREGQETLIEVPLVPNIIVAR